MQITKNSILKNKFIYHKCEERFSDILEQVENESLIDDVFQLKIMNGIAKIDKLYLESLGFTVSTDLFDEYYIIKWD